MKRPLITDPECKRITMHDIPIVKYSKLQDKYIDELETLKNTFFDFMQNIDNYNVDIPTIMYDEWNEVNKLVGRD